MKRPGVVTFVGVIVVIQGLLGLVAAAMTFAFRTSGHVQVATGLSPDSLLWSAIGEAIVGLIVLVVGLGVLGGGRVSRLIVAIAEVLRMVAAGAFIFTHHQGGYLWSGLLTIGIGVVVLWALYGDERSEAYFEGGAEA